MKKDLTELVFILDRSGSMFSIWDDAAGSFEAFVEEQKQVPGEANLTLAVFDDRYDEVLQSKTLAEVDGMIVKQYPPRGMTALLDAVGKTIATVGERIKNMPEEDRPEKVAVAIMTDGCENSSSEYTGEKIKEMIEHQTDKYKWEFFFLGANVDAFANGGGMGIPMMNTMNFAATSKGIRCASKSYSETMTQYRTGQNHNLSDHDQQVTDGDE